MTEYLIFIVVIAVVVSFVSKKVLAAVCKGMGWDNPFVSVKELMRQGHSFPEAMAISRQKRSDLEMKGFAIGLSMMLRDKKRRHMSREEYEMNEKIHQEYMMNMYGNPEEETEDL